MSVFKGLLDPLFFVNCVGILKVWIHLLVVVIVSLLCGGFYCLLIIFEQIMYKNRWD